MDYQNYENYMREILGYNTNNIYNNAYSNFGNDRYYPEYYSFNTNIESNLNSNCEDLNEYYPEIYKITYPAVCKICNQNKNKKITKDLIESMSEEIYLIIEPENNNESAESKRDSLPPLRNGDVRNPNAKEYKEKIETRHKNFLLQDLIKILILREFKNLRRPGNMMPPPPPPRPPMPPIYNHQYDGGYGRPF